MVDTLILWPQEWVKNVTAGKLSKSDKLGQVDHSTIDYPPFRRNFYMEAQDLQRMTDKQVAEFRQSLDDVKVRGVDVPKPIKNWFQCGLSGRILDVLKKSGFEGPMPIQVCNVLVLAGQSFLRTCVERVHPQEGMESLPVVQ